VERERPHRPSTEHPQMHSSHPPPGIAPSPPTFARAHTPIGSG
jgi:hypothetical protein